LKSTIALALSMIALAIALSGTAAVAGGLISGSQIANHSIHKDKLARDARAPHGLRGFTGPQGPAGEKGPQGPKGDKGDDGKPSKVDYGVAKVNVSRGGGAYTAWATYSTALGSPVGDTTGGVFRFTCSTANAPCKVKVTAAILGSSNHAVYPRLLLYRQDFVQAGPGPFPEVYCEYADGSTGSAPFPLVGNAGYSDVPVNIGGTDDCGLGGPAGDVDQITVPAGYYDVNSTFVFLPAS
jgi:hypothetical protein